MLKFIWQLGNRKLSVEIYPILIFINCVYSNSRKYILWNFDLYLITAKMYLFIYSRNISRTYINL